MHRRVALLTALALLSGPVRAAGPAQVPGAVNTDGGVAIGGHDPVAYFTEGRATPGREDLAATHDGVTYRFASEANRAAFLAGPARYLPQYGGYCAYGMARGYKAAIDPAAFTIADGRLYLNYNAGIQTQWRRRKDAEIRSADANWPKVIASTKVNR